VKDSKTSEHKESPPTKKGKMQIEKNPMIKSAKQFER
jgi:hypothetical protein